MEDGEIAIYIGRPSPLGNPFPLARQHTEAEREECVSRYGHWLNQKLAEGNPRVVAAVQGIEAALKSHDVGLECYCAPKRCHGEKIIEAINHRRGGT